MAGEGLTGKQAKKVQQVQRKNPPPAPPRGSVTPPQPAVTNMPADPASASVSFYAGKMQAERRPQIEAARSVQQAKTTQRQAQKELIARADQKSYQRHIEFDQAHGIQPTNEVYHKDDTTLLLNSIGYTGNDMRDFNAQVSRINKVFNEVYGYSPTPGLVLDLVRSPASADPQALRNLLTGQPDKTFTQTQQGMLTRGGVLVQTQEQKAREGERAGLESALRLSLYTNNHEPLFAAASQILNSRRDRDLLARFRANDPAAMSQLASIVPGNGDVTSAVSDFGNRLQHFGFTPQQFAGRSYMANQHILDNAVGKITGQIPGGHLDTQGKLDYTNLSGAMGVIADWQKKMNAKYNLGLTVSGVVDDSWAKAVVNLSHSRGYASQLLAQDAQNAGFGTSFDSFNAFDENGNFANNSDGRAAKDAMQTYVAAQTGQTKFLKEHHWWQQLGTSMPLQFFDKGGWSWGSGVDWILGGSGHGVTTPWTDPLAVLKTGSDVATIAEHSLIRGVGTVFSGVNGLASQGKSDIYSWEAAGFADPSKWSQADAREVAKRLSEQDTTWLNVLGVSKQWTSEHEKINFLTNLAGDLIIFKKLGSTGETLKAGGQWENAMRDAMTSGDMSLGRALVKRSNYARERVDQMWKYGRSGNMRRMANAGDGAQAGDAIATPEWVVDDASPFGDQFVLKDGRPIRPLGPGEATKAPPIAEPPQGLVGTKNVADPEGADVTHVEFHPSEPIEFTKGGQKYRTNQFARFGTFTHWDGKGFISGLHVPPELRGNRTLVRDLSNQIVSQMHKSDITRFIPDPMGMTEDGLKVWRNMARRIESGKMPGWRVMGEAQRGEKSVGEMGIGGPTFDLQGQYFEKIPVAPAKELETHSWFDLLHKGMIDQNTHENIASWYALMPQKILDTWKAPTVPARSGLLMQRVQRFGLKGRVPIATPHPLAYSRAKVWQGVSAGMDWSERSLGNSWIPGTTRIDHILRGTRRMFTRAANPRELPVAGVNPDNIFRMALEAGLKATQGSVIKGEAYASADKLTELFIRGRAAGDSAQIQKALGDISKAAAAQGRMAVSGGAKNVFAAIVHRGEEHLHYAEADAESLFGKKGVLSSRNWAAFPSTDQALRARIKAEGLQPTDIEVNGEPHLFVPGMSQQEAKDLAGENGVLTPKGQIVGDTIRPAKISGESLQSWKVELGKEHQIADEHLRSLPFGEVKAASQRDAYASALANAKTPEEREYLAEKLANARETPTPTLPEETLQNVSVPTLLQPKPGNLSRMNDAINTFGLLQRRFLLTPNAALFSKHAVTDSIRRMIAEGSILDPKGLISKNPLRVFRVFNNRGHFKEMMDWLKADGNEQHRAFFDSMYDLAKNSDYRYDVEGRGAIEPAVFWTGNAPDKWLHAAAGYIHRRVMSGAYQAWKVDGRAGVRRWFTEDPEGIKLAEGEGFGAEDSHILADQVSENLGTIQDTDPSFLREAESISRNAKDVRKALAQYMRKHDINIPVTGHVPSPRNGIIRRADDLSNKMIGMYLTANKWNRGGLFQDITGRLFHDYAKMGTPKEDAFMAAVSQARLISRYHMLDLADALKAEQTFRWGALFFTKHRLYWNWLLQTMRTRPELAVAVGDLQGAMDKYSEKFPNQAPGTFTVKVPGMGGQLLTIPVARLLWLTEAEGSPGLASSVFDAWRNGTNMFPSRGQVSFSTIDSSINQAYLLARHYLGDIKTSKGVEDSMNPQDRMRFRQVYARIQGSYFAEHGHYMDDSDATTAALWHTTVTSFWRNTAFTGSYPEDVRMSTKQDKVWKAYNQTVDPTRREALRNKYPFLNQNLGIYNQSPSDRIQTQQFFNQYNAIRADHETRQDALLSDFKSNPSHIQDLFGGKWNAEGKRYAAEIDALIKQAKQAGATNFVDQFTKDHFAQAHKLLAAQLHQMYGIPEKQALKISVGSRPNWVDKDRELLRTSLSDKAIKTYPLDQQQNLQEAAAIIRERIRPWNKEPDTAADALRDRYFKNVYDPWRKARDAWFQKANTEDKNDQGRTFDAMREWMDKQDHPFKVQGIEFPSPVRTHFAMLPRELQTVYRRNILTKNWSYLSRFDKHLLGETVPQSVQDGWTYFNKTIYEAIAGPQGTIHKAGVHPSLDDLESLKYAEYVDTKYPGFAQDYARSLVPIYARLGQEKLGSNAASQATWDAWLGKVAQIARWWGDADGAGEGSTEMGKHFQGPMGAVKPVDPAYMAVRASLFRRQVWTDLLQYGRQGVYNNLPLARPPDNEYIHGGVLYQMAMAQPNRTFKQEIRQWTIADPNWMYKLFLSG